MQSKAWQMKEREVGGIQGHVLQESTGEKSWTSKREIGIMVGFYLFFILFWISQIPCKKTQLYIACIIT